MPKLYFGSLLLVFMGCQKKSSFDLSNGTWIDLSHAYEKQTPYWPTASGFELDTVFAGMTDKGYYYSAYEFKIAEHGGTHIDAPVHFAAGKKTVDQITLDQLIGNGIVIDVQDSVDIIKNTCRTEIYAIFEGNGA